MNKSLYKIVFNQSRGQLMAVAETAGAQGKSASGETSSPNSPNSFPSRGKAGMGASSCLNALSFCIAVTFGVFVAAPTQAQIKADGSAPKAQQPVILQTASVITQVNIATPSAQGVSRNTYSQFDVNRQGVILNNSRANVLTQLGGYASGNPMLAAGSARVILNEINSANPSYINGYVEVAGQRAEVVIANPSGINVNGGGFINASRATFTTGAPIMNGGSLEGYLVQRGTINISGAGLDASTTDYTGLLARAVQVNAGIWAKELKVVAGANQINEAQTTTTPTTGTGPAPSFSIDVAQLGGMYAGKITLIGTEAGVGVRNAGVIGATAGDVAISSNGWLSSISNSGTIYAAGNTALSAQGNITNTATGLIAALGNTSLAANGPGAQVITLAGSVLAAGLNAAGSLGATGDLSITSTAAAQLKGQFAAGGGLALTSASLDLTDITLAAKNANFNATTGDIDLSRSTVNTAGTFTANALQTLRTDGAAVTAGQLNIAAQNLSNVAGQIVQTGAGNTNINLAGNLNNTRGRIAANAQNLTLAAQTVNNTDGKLEHAGPGALSITANTFNGQRGQVTSNGALVMNGGAITLDNASTTASQITLNAASLSNRQGNIIQTGSGQTTISTTGALDNTGGNITSNGNTTITAQTLANQGGTVQATGNSNLGITTQGALDNSAAGRITAGGDVMLAADSLNNNAGSMAAAGALTATATQAINNTAGQIAANGNVSITASSLNNTRGTLASIQGNLQANATGSVINDSGTMQAALDTSITANGISNLAGKVTGRNVTLTASTGGINNSQGLVSATQSVTVQDSAAIKTLTITNTGGSIIAGGLAKVDAASLTGDGKVQSLGDVSIALTSDFNNQSEVLANNNLTFSTTGNLTNSNKLQAGSALTVSAANISNAATGEITGRSTTVTATNSLTNRGLIDGQTTQVNAPTLTNTGAGRIYGDDLSIASVNLSNASVIAARNKLDIGTTNLSNSPGATILSVGDMAIGGALDANRQAVSRASTISNHGATIQAMGKLNISAQTINNTNAGFTYAVYDVAGAGDTVYGTAGGAFYQSQGVNPSAPLAYYRQAGTGVHTYTLNPAAGQGWAGGYLIYNAVQYSTTEQRAVVTSTTPGIISSGTAMALDASSQINNDMSQILAGSSLGITGNASINNIQNTVATTTTQVGSNYTWGHFDGGGCGRGRCDRWLAYGQSGYYNSYASSTTLQGNYQSYTARAQSAATPTNAAAPAVAAPGTPAALAAVAGAGQATAAATQIRTSTPGAVQVPSSALYRINTNPANTFVVQTDPRFTNLRQWLSSDYMLSALNTNPSNITKRLGDGFYEQRLINEQVSQLTGRRFLGNFTSQDAQYQALMDAGITYARAFNLRPGIALTATQMAQLTSDIVWLVEQSVTFPDGSTVQALVPQVYVTNIRPGDIDGSGALLSAQAININVAGDVNNSGSIGGGFTGNVGSRPLVSINAANINNLYGSIQGERVSLSATNDITNTGGTLSAQSALSLNAGRDINLTSTTTSNKANNNPFSITQVDRLAGVYVTGLGSTPGSLNLTAGRDINAQAASIANTSTNGNTNIQATRDINLTTVSTDFAASVGGGANFMRMQTSQDVGTSISTQGDLTIKAGNNLTATAATVQSSQGNTQLIAGNTISLLAGQKTSDMAWGSETKSSGFMSSSSTTRRETGSSTQAVGTTVGGNTVNVTASKDINIKGSTVIADTNASLTAGNNINIEAAVNTSSQSSFTETKESGFLSGGGFGITYGKREQSLDQKSQNTTAAASTVGAITGNININAGQTFRQVGSDIIAPAGDINITAKKVDIIEARETSLTTTEQKFKQTALTLSVSSPVISAIQQGQAMAQAASQTSSGRMQALAAASTALNVYNNAGAISEALTNPGTSNPAAAARINLSLGTSKSQSNSSSQSDTARGSTVGAGRNVNITATGAGQDSNILIQGSDVKAGNNTTLTADNQINLLAAKNESSQTSTNSSSSGSLSVSWGAGGWGAGASASKGKGKSDGQDTTFTNTNVSAGNTATIKSGGDTNVIGATVEANQIKADIGGSLKIESLQDKSTYASSQQNVSGSVSVGGGGNGASVSANKSNVDSNFQSVGQQSGLKAGDGGFQVSVNNNTALTGAVIASTQQAINDNRNTFTTGGALSITDVQNTASFKGTAVGFSAGYSGGKPSGSAGMGSTGGNAASTSSAGISGIAGNTAVRTGDAETGLKPIFNADKVQKEINAQVAITAAFGSQASKTIGNYAATQMDEAAKFRIRASSPNASLAERESLTSQADAIEKNWGDNGILRIAAHTVVGGLTGGASGAAGTLAGTLAAPVIQDQLTKAGITGGLSNALVTLGSAAVGGALGGTAGAAGAFNEVQNNYLTPRENLARNKAASACSSSGYSDAKSCGEANRLNNLDKTRDNQIAAAVSSCQSSNDAQTCNNASNMVNDLKNKGMLELQQLAVELAPTCAPPRDCTQAANWGRTELSTLTGANQQLWPYVASGAVQSVAPELALIGAPAGATRFTAMQLAKPVEQFGSISFGQYASGAVISGAIGTGVYGLSNLADIENITPANLGTVFIASAIGSGLVRRELNAVSGLRNTSIPYTLSNAATHGTGAAVGFGSIGWLNSTNAPISGVSWFTQPLWPAPIVTRVLPVTPSSTVP